MASLFSKHVGFEDEREWRVVYRPEWDEQVRFQQFFSYHHAKGEMEPKLKLPISRIPGTGENPLTIGSLVERILLGPVAAKDLVLHSFKRMLELRGLGELVRKTHASKIPFRG